MSERRFTITWGERTFVVRGCTHPADHQPAVTAYAYASIALVNTSYDYVAFAVHGREAIESVHAHSDAEARDIAAELARRMEACR